VNDVAVGAPFDDVIYGDNGNDYVFGGHGSLEELKALAREAVHAAAA
jgi:hypothetical protein